ncbi:GerMN domain-containing protein [Clostridium sp. Sa3CUN1]|uniref:GerMN domain-containing protein n=1 Tax=Clostridium gallinarum TaxID=2762246 RepID=A0ABR8Q3G8_9CLOT|nr:GerMN domain-containing protein [Clostridium gallinarum]MBD7914960.1 GerMN domain-containing protein [Clostridium gallinarum]
MQKKFFLLFFSFILSFILIGCNKSNDISNLPNKENESFENENNKKETPITNEEKNNISNNSESLTKKNVRLFYFDTINYELYYVDKEVDVTDKAIIKSLTTELQNYSPNKNFLNLTKDVEITSASLDESTGLLKIVFSSSYIDKMLLGSATESGLLSSLLSTYGYNLNIKKVAIYFKDELYSSLRGDLPEGYFNVDYTSAIPYSEETYSTDIKTSSNITNINCRIYYYNASDDMYYYKDKSIEVIDSALVTALTNEIKNIPNDNLLKFGDNLAVKSAKLNNDTLTVDLSESYYNLLKNFGSGTEAAALKTLALTYSYNYNVNKVIILVDGKPYEGSHIIFNANESININVINIKEYQ